MTSILINCSNLHNGGGVSVATSFLAKLLSSGNQFNNIGVIASSSVHQNIISLGFDPSAFADYRIVNYHGIEAIWKGLDKHFIGYDAVFTVFGPAYFVKKRCIHVFGFAQPSIAYPDNAYSRQLPLFTRIVTRLKFFLQALFFSRADKLVVELEHVEVALRRQWLFSRTLIDVVYNTADDVYRDRARWQYLNIPIKEGVHRFGVISRNYPHKNLSCLSTVRNILKNRYHFETEFFVTFNDKEWSAVDSDFKNEITNIGPITLAQCPSFYRAMDGVVFPTLLECFSAVPIETMMMKKPLFASNLPFLVDCCGQHAIYFDPLDSNSIAKSVYDFFIRSEVERVSFVSTAHDFVQRYPDAQARANSYLTVVQNAVKTVNHG
jgi:hypothetical protein